MNRLPHLLLLSLLAAACSDGAITEAGSLAGEYSAHRSSGVNWGEFTTTTDGVQTDQLAQGASIEIRLSPDGTTSGRIIVPGELDESLQGTWRVVMANGLRTVHFDQPADTFLRDMPFTVEQGRLEGDRQFGGTRTRVTLRRR